VVSPIRDSEGKPERLLAVPRDVTKHKQSEEALRNSEEVSGTFARQFSELIIAKMKGAWLLYGDGQAAVESMTCGFERTAEVSKSRGYRNIPRARCHSHA